MGNDLDLPGVTLDPRNEAELAAAFGVTSNAEELVKANRARYTREHREVLTRDPNPGLTDSLYELDEDGNRLGLKDDLEKQLGFPAQTVEVRGSGRRATISYTYIGDRGSIEKGIISYAEVMGSASQKRAARTERATADPSAAGSEAAQAKLNEAETKVAEILEGAQSKVQEMVDSAQAKAQEIIADAQAKAEEIRAAAAEEAPAAAAEAEDEAKAAAARGGASGGTPKKPTGGARGGRGSSS